MFKIILTGKLRSGASRQQVVANLSRLTKLPANEVEAKLLSGRRVIIKKVNDPAIAKQYCTTLLQAGVIAEVVREKTAQQDSSVTPNRKSGQKSGRSKSFKKFIASVTALCLLLGGGGYWVHERYIAIKVPASVVNAENALATSNAILLGHMNFSRILELQSSFLGIQPEQEIKIANNNSMFSRLYHSDLDIQHSLDQALLGLYVDERQQSWSSLVLFGLFPVAQVRQFILQHFAAEETEIEGVELLIFNDQDEETCRMTELHAISINEDRIVISSPKQIISLIKRLEQQTKAAQDLNQWRHFREQHLVSATLFAPQKLVLATQGLAQQFLKKIKSNLDSIDATFFGATTQIFPPALVMSAQLMSRQEAWASQAAQASRAAVSAKQRPGVSSEALSALLAVTNISQHSAQFNVHVHADETVRHKLLMVVEELATQLFSYTVATEQASTDQHEVVDDEAQVYEQQYSVAQLPRFDRFKNPAFLPDWIDGPFGLRLEKVKLIDNGILQLYLKGEGRDIKNVSDKHNNAALKVTDVIDGQGQSLLREESCGRSRNDAAAYFDSVQNDYYEVDGQQYPYKALRAVKTARLRENKTLEDIAVIKGQIEMSLPAELETIVVPAPLAGKQLAREGLSLKFIPSGSRAVAYTSEGNNDMILDVRALNQHKQYLRQSRGYSAPALFNETQNYYAEFQGDIAFVEFTLIKQAQQVSYPFTLTQATQFGSSYRRHTSAPVHEYSGESFARRYVAMLPIELPDTKTLGAPYAEFHQGPINLGIYQLSPENTGISGSIILLTPLIPGLEHNKTALQFSVQRVTYANGDSYQVNNTHYIKVLRPSLKIKSYGSGVVDSGEDYLIGATTLQIDHNASYGMPRQLSGKVRVAVPREIRRLRISQLGLGAQQQVDGLVFQFIELSDHQLGFLFTGDQSKIINVRVYDDREDEITLDEHQFSVSGNQVMLKVGYAGFADSVEVLYGERLESAEYSYTLLLPEL